jgi:pyruvate dehydrogenase E1 component beta subunit
VSVELIDLRSINPFDRDAVVQSVQKTGRCVVVHEAAKTLGMGAEIATILQEEAFLYLQAPVQRVTGFDTIMPYYKLENDYLPNAAKIQEAIEQVLAY